MMINLSFGSQRQAVKRRAPQSVTTAIKTATISAVLMLMLTLSGCQKDTDAEDIAVTPDNNSQKNSQNTGTTTQKNQQQNSESLTILALGDSLTEGLGVAADANYPAQLEARLQELGYDNVKVINSGLSGETSTGLVNRLDWVTQTKPDITILTIGANDAIRGIEVATVEANIRKAVKHLQDNGSQVILGGMQIYDNLGSDYVQAFAAMYPRIAEDMQVTLIPFMLEGVAADQKLNQADAIHPTAEGYTLIVDNNILPILKPELKKILTVDSNVLAPAEMQPTETK